ncbi:YEATS domain-containing protein 4 isoform X4 [Macaca fascicularis]|uniref:YEATS domain-containing protein 4 isoform X4 n=1 Tax=Macaca fascicularis TaxID=9541 RepID=UPI003D15AEB2
MLPYLPVSSSVTPYPQLENKSVKEIIISCNLIMRQLLKSLLESKFVNSNLQKQLSQPTCVTLYHLLKLFQSDTNAMLGKKTVVSEFYDEMIFQDPTAMMQQLLTTSRQLTLGAYKHETEFAELEVKTREKLEAAKKKTSFEIAELKERLKASRETINCLKNEIRKLEEDDQAKDI